MDPVTIGATVVSILTPYVADAGKELVKTAGEAGLEKIKGLLHWLKGKFAGDPVATSDLSRFEKDPTAFAPALQATVVSKVKDDPAFAAEIGQRVKELGPIITIIQNYENAKNLVGLKADRVTSGKVSITQTGKIIDGGTGAEIKTIE
jgi:hypothetical protein